MQQFIGLLLHFFIIPLSYMGPIVQSTDENCAQFYSNGIHFLWVLSKCSQPLKFCYMYLLKYLFWIYSTYIFCNTTNFSPSTCRYLASAWVLAYAWLVGLSWDMRQSWWQDIHNALMKLCFFIFFYTPASAEGSGERIMDSSLRLSVCLSQMVKHFWALSNRPISFKLDT